MGQFTGESSVRRVVFSIIGVLCLLLAGLSANVAIYVWQKLRSTDRVVTGVALGDRLLAISGQLAVERDMMHVALVAPEPALAVTLDALATVRQNIDEQWTQMGAKSDGVGGQILANCHRHTRIMSSYDRPRMRPSAVPRGTRSKHIKKLDTASYGTDRASVAASGTK